MPWIEGSKTFTVEDTGKTLQGSTGWAKATLIVTTSGNTLSYTITMETTVNGGHKEKPAVALYLAINGTGILNNYWRYNTNSDKWNNFPTYNGSTYSNTLNIADADTIPVSLKICTMQDATKNSSLWQTTSGNVTRTWYTAIGSTSVSITDNGNNTFTVKGTKGSDGTNNTASGPTITYSYDSATYDKSVSNNTAISLAGTAASRTVYAKAVTTATHGSNTSATTSKVIKRYVAPSLSDKPALTSNSLKNGRLTNRTTWTYDWSDATAGNDNSPVQKYFIRIFKNSTAIKDIDNLANSKYSFNPNDFGFVPGNKVKVSVWAGTVNGAGTVLWSNEITSVETLIENSAVIHANDGTWHEGIAYINKGTASNPNWVEAEEVFIKDKDGGWHTSV